MALAVPEKPYAGLGFSRWGTLFKAPSQNYLLWQPKQRRYGGQIQHGTDEKPYLSG
jgi:hypothetical protein